MTAETELGEGGRRLGGVGQLTEAASTLNPGSSP